MLQRGKTNPVSDCYPLKPLKTLDKMKIPTGL